jgi:hypothetical protein
MTGQSGAKDDVERKVGWRARLAHLLRDAPTTAEFHGAGIHRVGARMIDRAVTLLDEYAFYPAPPKVGGQRKSDRPAADDEDRYFVSAPHAGDLLSGLM